MGKRIPNGSAVEVMWEDANGADAGWVSADTILHSAESVCTVGILLNQNTEGYTVVLSLIESSQQVGAFVFIPKPFVTSIRRLVFAE